MPAIIASSVSAVVLFLVFGHFQITGYTGPSDGATVLNGTNMQLVVGVGATRNSSIVIESVDANGLAIISSGELRLDTSTLTSVRWQIDGLTPDTTLALLWSTRRQPNQLFRLPIEHAGRTEGVLEIGRQSGDWTGFVGALGLQLESSLTDPVVVHGLTVDQTQATTLSQLARQLWIEWTAPEPWNARSINFLLGGKRDGLVSLSLAVSVWVLLALVLYLVYQLFRRRRWSLVAGASIFLAGWLVLDARWQWNLWRQHTATYQQFAGKSWEEKHRAGEDGDLFEFARAAKRVLPTSPARLYIVSKSPSGSTHYTQLRLRYHLLPHNIYSYLELPPPAGKARKGDYVLILLPVPGIAYDQEQRTLIWGEPPQQLPVKIVYSTELGLLLEVVG